MSADYIDRVIETVRQHKDADNSWPQWANVLADEIVRLRGSLSRLERESNEKHRVLWQRWQDEIAARESGAADKPANEAGHSPANDHAAPE